MDPRRYSTDSNTNIYGEGVSSAIDLILSLVNGLPTAWEAIDVPVVGQCYCVAAVV
jgi:hypothetical protein